MSVIQTIQAARTGSTTACYREKWLGFQHRCEDRSLDPLSCAVEWVLSFLQCLSTKIGTNETLQESGNIW